MVGLNAVQVFYVVGVLAKNYGRNFYIKFAQKRALSLAPFY
jgi:hypothetical protein